MSDTTHVKFFSDGLQLQPNVRKDDSTGGWTVLLDEGESVVLRIADPSTDRVTYPVSARSSFGKEWSSWSRVDGGVESPALTTDGQLDVELSFATPNGGTESRTTSITIVKKPGRPELPISAGTPSEPAAGTLKKAD